MDNAQNITAASWRNRFDSDPKAATLLHLGFSLGSNSDGSYDKPACYSDDTPDRSYGRYMQKQ